MNSDREELEFKIDILEDDIASIDPILLKILLQDKTTRKNIMWCTRDYESYGLGFSEHSQIQVEQITGYFSKIIQPRAAKTKEIQEQRIRNRAEVFTPSWICNEQNNIVDESWFGRKNVFNISDGTGWIVVEDKIAFLSADKTWKNYVDTKRLEITCGEAPYLVSRYDTTTGEFLSIDKRIGLFDRKMRIVNENCEDSDDWIKWSLRAIKSVYGYEFQGDSLLIARENLLYSYIDYYRARFNDTPSIELLKDVANIIAWNIWQMDGLKCVVPYSCYEIEEEYHQISLFDEEVDNQSTTSKCCPGCKRNNLFKHTGIYCRIYDWTNLNKSIPFVDMFKGV